MTETFNNHEIIAELERLKHELKTTNNEQFEILIPKIRSYIEMNPILKEEFDNKLAENKRLANEPQFKPLIKKVYKNATKTVLKLLKSGKIETHKNILYGGYLQNAKFDYTLLSIIERLKNYLQLEHHNCKYLFYGLCKNFKACKHCDEVDCDKKEHNCAYCSRTPKQELEEYIGLKEQYSDHNIEDEDCDEEYYENEDQENSNFYERFCEKFEHRPNPSFYLKEGGVFNIYNEILLNVFKNEPKSALTYQFLFEEFDRTFNFYFFENYTKFHNLTNNSLTLFCFRTAIYDVLDSLILRLKLSLNPPKNGQLENDWTKVSYNFAPRKKQVIELTKEHKTAREIAKELNISSKTVEKYKNEIKEVIIEKNPELEGTKPSKIIHSLEV